MRHKRYIDFYERFKLWAIRRWVGWLGHLFSFLTFKFHLDHWRVFACFLFLLPIVIISILWDVYYISERGIIRSCTKCGAFKDNLIQLLDIEELFTSRAFPGFPYLAHPWKYKLILPHRIDSPWRFHNAIKDKTIALNRLNISSYANVFSKRWN